MRSDPKWVVYTTQGYPWNTVMHDIHEGVTKYIPCLIHIFLIHIPLKFDPFDSNSLARSEFAEEQFKIIHQGNLQ